MRKPGREARASAMIVRCNWCLAILTEPGALLFTPIDRVTLQCTKIHIGVNCGCYAKMIKPEPPKAGEEQP